MSDLQFPRQDPGDAERRPDCGAQGRVRRAARLFGATTRTACEAAIVTRRGRHSEAEIKRFHERTAERYANLFGGSKGVMLKIGQIISLALTDSMVPREYHPIYRQALARLRNEVPPMPTELARATLEQELGPVQDTFEWFDWEPFAAASVGQVHTAGLHDGRAVAVKIQYPGATRAIAADLKNIESLAAMLNLLASCLPEPRLSFDLRGHARELRRRIREELDYRVEMANQSEFADLYRGHPFIRVPEVVRELCTRRVLCQELACGLSWEQALAADQELRNRWAEAIWRFVFGSNARFCLLHGDPHPGNYLFHPDGGVTFLDFGCVKRFSGLPATMMHAIGVPCVTGDVLGTWRACLRLGFVQASAPVTPEEVFDYWRGAFEMYWREQPFALTPDHAVKWVEHRIDPPETAINALRHWTLPPDYAIMTRVETATNALFAQLRANNYWRAISAEYLGGEAPQTAMGRLDHDFFEGHWSTSSA